MIKLPVKKLQPIKHPSLSNIIDFSKGGIKADRKQTLPIQVLPGNEDIWSSKIYKPKAKLARK